MKISTSSTFKRNLNGFLGAARLSRTTSAGQLTRATKSLSADPVEPIDAVFTTISENYESQDHLDGFQSVTRQLLANEVLDSLIQMQSEMSLFGDFAPGEMEGLESQAAEAYQTAQNYKPTFYPR